MLSEIVFKLASQTHEICWHTYIYARESIAFLIKLRDFQEKSIKISFEQIFGEKRRISDN